MESETKRFVYQTQGVCPPEIHFRLKDMTLEEVRFIGGGCPGNAQLVARLLQGLPIDAVMEKLAGIDCRDGTSCPDQLATAIQSAVEGRLKPADSFRVFHAASNGNTVGMIGGVDGNPEALQKLVDRLRSQDVGTIFCMGNLTGNTPENAAVIRILQKQNLVAVHGDRDWRYAAGCEEGLPPISAKDRDWMVRLPQVLSFQMPSKKGIAFFGQYIQSLPGFSDFEPYALEMNMVCDLTDFMQDTSVFPALEAMIPQFQADIIVFGQTRQWGHWHVAGKDFISLGAAASTVNSGGLSCTVLTNDDHQLRVETLTVDA